MNSVSYKSSFNEVLKLAKEKKLFVGTGNPNGKILFIGKEAAINKEICPEQYHREIENNNSDWCGNVSNNIQFSDVDNWFVLSKYNPLYPYKGQKNKIESKDKTGNIIRGKLGTSRTWYNYQKVIDSIYFDNNASELINFHEFAFCSELNQETGSYSNEIPKIKRKKSIENRKELFQKSFFKQFPVTIVAVGHYVRDFNINLECLFEMKYSKELSEVINKEFINIHYDDLERPTKLLIHTNQLSRVSNELITRLSVICSDFLKK